MLSVYKFKVCSLLVLVGTTLPAWADKIHDPTQPKRVVNIDPQSAATRVQTEQELKLQGIVSKRNTRMAIISGQLHQLGEEISGYRISQINKDYVVLTKSGSEKRWYVYE